MCLSDYGGRRRAAVSLPLVCVADLKAKLGLRPCPADEEPGVAHQRPVLSANPIPRDAVLLAPLVSALQPI